MKNPPTEHPSRFLNPPSRNKSFLLLPLISFIGGGQAIKDFRNQRGLIKGATTIFLYFLEHPLFAIKGIRQIVHPFVHIINRCFSRSHDIQWDFRSGISHQRVHIGCTTETIDLAPQILFL